MRTCVNLKNQTCPTRWGSKFYDLSHPWGLGQPCWPYFFGTGVVVSIPKKKWEIITAGDLENARPQIREGDIVIVNASWHNVTGNPAAFLSDA